MPGWVAISCPCGGNAIRCPAPRLNRRRGVIVREWMGNVSRIACLPLWQAGLAWPVAPPEMAARSKAYYPPPLEAR